MHTLSFDLCLLLMEEKVREGVYHRVTTFSQARWIFRLMAAYKHIFLSCIFRPAFLFGASSKAVGGISLSSCLSTSSYQILTRLLSPLNALVPQKSMHFPS
jgi:hypothetical protein